MNACTSNDLQTLLESSFGWSEFKPGQTDVILRLMEGKSVLAVFPTGGGKSLCYQMPALQFEGLTVVVSPLIALMKDQIDQLTKRGHTAVRLDSSLSSQEYRQAAQQIRDGQAKLLYVSPERFFNERFRSSLDGIRISLFAIDEAHCISQWGHNFRPDYLKLANIASELNAERVLALTATATPTVQEDICRAFDIQPEDVVCTEFFRPNLHLRTQLVTEATREETLVKKLTTQPAGATIVYVTRQKTAEHIAGVCQTAGLDARAYHAGMDPRQRNEIQEWFMAGEDPVVVATIAFGMGIDKSDIRYVYHFNPPKSIESYAQEIGRAGRDGKASHCEMLLLPDDRVVLENFVYGDTPNPSAIEIFFREIDKQPQDFFVSQYQLANACDIKGLVTKTLLTYLELDGFIKATSPQYDAWSFKPCVSSETIVGNFEGERKKFVKGLLACSQKRKIWFTLDVPTAIQRLNCDRDRIVRALDFFAENQWIELRVSGLVHGYRRLKPLDDIASLTDEYNTRLLNREASGIGRIDEVMALAAASECQAAALSSHFGQPRDESCGHCSFCRGEGNLNIAPPSHGTLDAGVIEQLQRLIQQHAPVLNSARSRARFLCGLTSPALTQAKLSRHSLFGVCDKTPFAHVMKQAESL